MKTIVCVKQILDPRGISVNRKAEKVFVNREEYMLDPASKAALEAAEQIKAKEAAVEIIALSVGPERVDEALREALARGADRAIWIRSDNNPDPTVIANLLAAAINRLGSIDLVLCGDRSLDAGSGEIAARLAEALDWPQVLRAAKAEVKGSTLAALVQHSSFVAVETSLPAVVSIAPEAFSGQHANGWRLMDAYKKWQVETWTTEDLALSEDDLHPTTAKKEDAFPPERQPGTKVHNAKELVAMLKQEKILV